MEKISFSRLDGRVASVDADLRAGHEPRRVAREEHDRARKVLGLAHLWRTT